LSQASFNLATAPANEAEQRFLERRLATVEEPARESG
jgi:hypothetical protein